MKGFQWGAKVRFVPLPPPKETGAKGIMTNHFNISLIKKKITFTIKGYFWGDHCTVPIYSVPALPQNLFLLLVRPTTLAQIMLLPQDLAVYLSVSNKYLSVFLDFHMCV